MERVNKPNLSRQWATVAMAAILAIAAVLRLSNLTFHSLDLDESVSVWLARQPTLELIRNTLNLGWDPHPPGFYLLLKAWTAVFGSGQIALRLLPALFGIAFVGLVWLVGQRLFDSYTGLIAAGLVAANPLLIWLSQEVRMYMPVAVLSLASLYCLIRALDIRDRLAWGWWLGYALAALAACYFHLFAFLLLPVAAAYILIRGARQRELWVVGGVAVALVCVAYLPFAINAWKAGQIAPEINVYPLLAFKDQLYELMLAFTARFLPEKSGWLAVPMVLSVALAVVGLWPSGHKPEAAREGRRGGVLLIAWLLVPLIAFFWITAKRPVFNPKYLVVLLAAFWLALAAGIARLGRWNGWLILPALLPVALMASLGWRYVWSTQALREDWRTAAQYVSERATTEDKVFVHLHYAHIPFDYYYTGQADVVAPLGSRPPATEDLDELLAPYGGASVLWLVQSQEWNTDPQHVVERWFFDRGPMVTEQYPVGMSIKAYALRYRLGGVPDSAYPAAIHFGERLRLVGYQLDQTRLAPYSDRLHPPSNWIHLTLYWQVDWPLEDEMVTVVEMTDNNGGVWGGKLEQGRNVVNYYRPQQWQPGEVIRDDYDINLNPVTPTGMYHIRVGVRTPALEMFWPISGAAVQQERAVLTDVYIENGRR